MDNDSGDLSEDSTVLDSDDAEESNEIFSNNISIKKLSQSFILAWLMMMCMELLCISLMTPHTKMFIFRMEWPPLTCYLKQHCTVLLCMLKKKQYKTAKEYLKNLIENIENASDESK